MIAAEGARNHGLLNVPTEDFFQTRHIFPMDIAEQQKIAQFLTLLDKRIAKQRELVESLKSYKRGVLSAIFSRKIRFHDEDGKEFPEWKNCKLGDILKILHGRDYKHLLHGKYPVLGTGGVISYVDKYLCDWECVLIGRKGTIDCPQYMNTPFWSVDTLFYSKPKNNQCVKFQYYLFQTINWKLYDDSTGVPSLSASTIENISVKIPVLLEQIIIADYLSKIDKKIEHAENLLKNLSGQKQALLQQLFI